MFARGGGFGYKWAGSLSGKSEKQKLSQVALAKFRMIPTLTSILLLTFSRFFFFWVVVERERERKSTVKFENTPSSPSSVVTLMPVMDTKGNWKTKIGELPFSWVTAPLWTSTDLVSAACWAKWTNDSGCLITPTGPAGTGKLSTNSTSLHYDVLPITAIC